MAIPLGIFDKKEKLSIVIPLYNEEENVRLMYEKVKVSLDKLKYPYEIIFVNDGSTDKTYEILCEISNIDSGVLVINFRRNYGQTAAMSAGIDKSSGDIIIPMDGDLQNDPKDIKQLLMKLEEGYDVVSGWRKNRKDNKIIRNLPSKIANKIISKISGVYLHDYGCSLKAYRKEVIKDVRLYGEMHRFIPIYASWQGARVTEIPVDHHARQFGKSKYGIERTIKVVLDLIVVKFLSKYSVKPIYIFGGFGILNISLGIISGLYALYLKIIGTSFILTPLPLLVVMFWVMGIMSILLGLLAEVLMRTYFESQGKNIYEVKNVLNGDK